MCSLSLSIIKYYDFVLSTLNVSHVKIYIFYEVHIYGGSKLERDVYLKKSNVWYFDENFMEMVHCLSYEFFKIKNRCNSYLMTIAQSEWYTEEF